MIKCYTDIRFTKGVDDMYRSAIEKLAKIQLCYVGFSQKNGMEIVHIDGGKLKYTEYPQGV